MLNIPVKINDPAVVVALKVLNIVPLTVLDIVPLTAITFVTSGEVATMTSSTPLIFIV